MKDKQNMLGSIELLGAQLKEGLADFSKVNLPESFKKINKIAFFGMGGSALGADLVRNIFASELKVPLIIIRDYSIPAWVDKNTLAVLSSYSGGTEETLTVAKTIHKRTKKVFFIATGGKLRYFSKFGFIINPHFNPCGQPRMGLGYALAACLGLFSSLNLIKITPAKFRNYKKEAFKVAKSLKAKIPVIVASEHLSGNAHVINNQINENAKSFASYAILPEMNHHLIEGLRFSSKNLFFIFLFSKKYFKRNQKRYKATEQVLRKLKIPFAQIDFTEKTKLAEALSVLSFGSYLGYFLALNYKIDPSPIPWVTYLKSQL